MPTPQATVICLSPRPQQILEQITRQTTTPDRVRQAQLILGAAQGKRNTELSAHLTLSRNPVQFWRDRWQQAYELLVDVERTDTSDLGLRYRIEGILSDEPRSGTGAKFSVEQIVQIVALACELPASSGRPGNHWSPGQLAED